MSPRARLSRARRFYMAQLQGMQDTLALMDRLVPAGDHAAVISAAIVALRADAIAHFDGLAAELAKGHPIDVPNVWGHAEPAAQGWPGKGTGSGEAPP